MIGCNQVHQSGVHDGQDRVFEDAVIQVACVCCLPMFVFCFANEVARIFEGWDPDAIDQASIPTNMINVEMSSHDGVELIGFITRLCQVF